MSVGPVALPAPDPPDFGRMVSQRLARLRREMQARDIHGTVLLHGPNVTYATGFVPEAVDASHAYHRRSVAIVSAAGGPARLHPHGPDGATGGTAPLGAASRGGGRAVAAATAGADRRAPLWPELDDGAEAVRAAIFEVLGDCAGRRVAVDAVTGAMARAGVLAGAELVDASRIVGPARVVKTPDELACIDRAQQRTERAMVAAQAACRPGVRRAEVAGAFLVALRNVEAVGGGAGRGGAGTSGMGGLVAPFQNGIDPIFQSMPARRDGGSRTSTGHVAFPTGVDNPAFAEGDWCGWTPAWAIGAICPTSAAPGWWGAARTPPSSRCSTAGWLC